MLNREILETFFLCFAALFVGKRWESVSTHRPKTTGRLMLVIKLRAVHCDGSAAKVAEVYRRSKGQRAKLRPLNQCTSQQAFQDTIMVAGAVRFLDSSCSSLFVMNRNAVRYKKRLALRELGNA